MANRTCDRCGGKASPWIPRKRSTEGDELLCAGCKQAEELRTSATVKTADVDPVPDHQPYASATSGNDDTDFGWENDLGPEGYHPLLAPLPNSVWEQFAKRQELRGKPIVPMRSQKIINERMRTKHGGKPGGTKRKGSVHTAHESPLHPHPVNHAEMKKHLVKEHGIAPGHLYGGDPAAMHHEDHQAHGPAATHTHPESESLPPAGDLEQHLQTHHGQSAADVASTKATIEAMGKSLADWHESNHSNYPTSQPVPHDHLGAANSAEASGKKQYGHPGDYGPQGMFNHLVTDHGMNPEEIHNAKGATAPNIPESAIYQGLHVKAHSQGIGTDGHDHDGYEKGDFTHVTPNGVSEHVAHLKHAHGMTDEQLEFHTQGGDEAAHLKLKKLHSGLHDPNDMKAMAQGDPGHSHTAHYDAGKPFVGANHSLYINGHLKNAHGLSYEQIDQLQSGVQGHDGIKHALEEAHQAFHAANGDTLDHQHVPTTHPGVKTKEQAAKDTLNAHLKEHHGYTHDNNNPSFEHLILHDPSAFGHPGHPGHEHNDDGSISMALPSKQKGDKLHYAHPVDMDHDSLSLHLGTGHGQQDYIEHSNKSHQELIQQHAQAHALGNLSHPHTHGISQSGLNDLGEKAYGGNEPEPLPNTHPAPEDESSALSHIIQHHPNASMESFDTWKKQQGGQPSMKDFHEKILHNPAWTNMAPPDGHDHMEPQGPHTDIPIGSHLISHHGMTQEQVAAMSPAEFKAHHEELHTRHDETDIGHGHVVPGGPVRDPRTHWPNPHHSEMRDDPNHPAVHEWYHGTGKSFEGPPMNATELQENGNGWGNYGSGDWNCHVGSHWSSLHQMSDQFDKSSRVIHARLHMKNPIVYNSLNHMAHDAYERLHASGDMQDGGEFHNNHHDSNDYNKCCADRLLEYAKGHHRSDGRFGLERFRDSLRASGHDGIVVRNQADPPKGHWNAIPLAADQIEITHSSCHGHESGDPRNSDVQEFEQNSGRLKKGWQHPKHYSPDQYLNGKDMPTSEEVDTAGQIKKQKEPPVHVREGRGQQRGDADPYLNGRQFGATGEQCDDCDEDGDHKCYDCNKWIKHEDWDQHEEEEHNQWCDHCQEDGNHDTEHCKDKWCSVCEEHGDHDAAEGHPYCKFCDDYADHDSDDHEDEWGEHPDKISPAGYCPHCEESTKQNYGKSECVNCGEDLPDWGKLATHGTPVKPEEYTETGQTSKYDYGPKKNASKDAADIGPGNSTQLAAHLYHHHKSDVGGKEYEDADGDFDYDKLAYHHQHLHADPGWAKDQGFEVGHTHPTLYPQFKSHESMTPAEIHAHMLLSHAATKDGGKNGVLTHEELLNMTSEEAVEHHKKLHAAQDAIPWGHKDEDGDLTMKVSHSHQLPDDHPTNAPEETSPKGQDLMDHMTQAHHLPALNSSKFKKTFAQPGVLEAFHQHVHDSHGKAADPTYPDYHSHAMPTEEKSKKQEILNHLAEAHGIDATHHMHDQLQAMSPLEVLKMHQHEHNSMFPVGNEPDHTHSNNNPLDENWVKKSTKASSAQITLTDYFAEVTA